MITSQLQYLARSSFHRPELVADDAAQDLDAMVGAYLDHPLSPADRIITLTSDGRPLDVELAALRTAPEEAGKSDAELMATAQGSLHVQGRAFDLRWPEADDARYWLVWVVMRTALTRGLVIELEPVRTHLHVGIWPPGTSHDSRLVFS